VTKATAAPDAGSVRCPPPGELAALLSEPGRTLRTDCIAFAPSYFWTAAALRYDDKTPPRLSLVTGGPGLHTMAFDVDPGPTEAISQLIHESRAVEVRIRATRSRQGLIRMGVVGRRDDKGVETDELAMVLQLVAHAAPRLVWAGAGDQTRAGADGCISERVLDFEMPFRRDLEVFTTSRSRPASPGRSCPPGGGPGTQEAVPIRAVPLKAGRALAAKP
jgi:hypothetical protein